MHRSRTPGRHSAVPRRWDTQACRPALAQADAVGPTLHAVRAPRLLAAVVAAVTLLTAAPARAEDPPATRIAICCTWGEAVRNGITFSIAAPNERLRRLIREGILSWASAVNASGGLRNTLVLTEVPKKGE